MKTKNTVKTGVRTKTPSKQGSVRARSAAWRSRKILVPMDFSEASDQALGTALQLAEQFDGKITLVHVVEPLIYPPDAGLVPMDQTDVVKASRKRLKEIAHTELPAARREKIVVALGNPAHEIADLARRQKSDLLVISTHGYTGLQHVLMGSTAERVVRHAPCPVMVLRTGK